MMVEGGIVFVDEMDANLHDVYLCALLEFLMEHGKGQLCFTTHNIGPMDVLKRNKKSIDFLSVNHKIYPWVTNGNYSPSKLYKNGMIEGSPFNIDSVDFLKIFEAPAFIKTEFRKQMDSAADWAKDVGMTEDDITEAKKTIRNRKKEK